MTLLDHIIFREYESSTRGLPIFRVLFALYILLIFLPRYEWISHFPDAFFHPPPGLTLFFSGFPSPWVFHGLHFGIALSALALLVGYRTRLFALALGALMLFGNAWAYSFGKINHDIFLIAVPLVMAFSGWDGRLTETSKKEHLPAWPLALLALLIGLGMLSAGAPKITSGWHEPDTLASLGHVIRHHYVVGADSLLGQPLMDLDSRALWILADYGALFLELGFILAIFHHRSMRLFCALAAFFHLGVYLVMGLRLTSVLPAYAAFVNWSLLLQYAPISRAASWCQKGFDRLRWPHLLVGAAFLTTFYTLYSNPWSDHLHILLLGSAALIALIYLAWESRQIYALIRDNIRS